MKKYETIKIFDEMTIEEIGNLTIAEVKERAVMALAGKLVFGWLQEYAASHNIVPSDEDTIEDSFPPKVLRDFELKALKKARRDARWPKK